MINEIKWENPVESQLQRFRLAIVMFLFGFGFLLFSVYVSISTQKTNNVVMGIFLVLSGIYLVVKTVVMRKQEKKFSVTLNENVVIYKVNDKQFQFGYNAIARVETDKKNLILRLDNNTCEIPLFAFEKANTSQEQFIEILTQNLLANAAKGTNEKISSMPVVRNHSVYYVFLAMFVFIALSGSAVITNEVVSHYYDTTIPDWKKTIAEYTLKIGAELGDKGKQTNLGFLYLQGNVVPHDEQQFLYWTMKAAKQNDHVAEYNLAIAYKDEHAGLKYNQKEVLYWLNKSAAGGYHNASELLTQLTTISVSALSKSVTLPVAIPVAPKNKSDDDVNFAKDLQDDPAI